MSNEKRCERCGGVIPADTPVSECPGCLLQAGLGAGESEGQTLDRTELQQLFPGLEIGAFIGRGGMGLVYKAQQLSLGRTVALKILSSDVAGQEAFAERFNREARALARLSHPNIVSVHESGRAGDYYYFIMEYVDGVNLRQAMQTGGLSTREALAIVPQICDALQYAHDQGVVHRDVKPENILLDQQGRVKMADFGLAKLLGGEPSNYTLTREREGMGTLHYIAPEQMRSAKDVDHRADIYSLGVVFYEMLTGDLPMGNFPPPSHKVKVDVHLDQVVLRAMEQERERRYQRVDEFKSGIQCPAAVAGTGRGDTAAGAGRETSKLALTGIMGLPTALLTLALAWAAGLRAPSELGGLVIAVATIGIVFSALGWRAIVTDPTRLSGLTLARLGALYPALIISPLLAVAGGVALVQGSVLAAIVGVLGIILFVVTLRLAFGLGTHSREMRHQVRRQHPALWVLGTIALVLFIGGAAVMIAFLLLPGGHHEIEDMGLFCGHDDVKELLVRVEAATKGGSVVDMSEVYHPLARRRLLALTANEVATGTKARDLGLGSLDLSSLPVPISEFTVRSVEHTERNKCRAFISFGDTRIKFPVAAWDDRWYLDLGHVLYGEGPGDGSE